MTKHVSRVDAPHDPDFPGKAHGDPGKPVPVGTFGELEALIGRAKLTGAPPAARFRLLLTMGGKLRGVVLSWED